METAIEGQQQGKSLAEGEREELKRLRKENKLLRMEKDILKKASAFFAKENGIALIINQTNSFFFKFFRISSITAFLFHF
jgi:hypothetical protein